jgi:uncharacterized circularly permuted ATP-grasp superfamily protein
MALTEYNAEVPAGAAYADALSDAFLDLPVMREFARAWRLWPIRSHHGVIHVLLDAWRQWSGSTTKPRIAILDWPDVPTYAEFVLYRDHFTALGIECVIADPRLAEYRDGQLWCEGQPVDLVYKRVLISELVERGGAGIDHPLLRAVRAGSVCMVNPLRCKILHKKASLAVLSDERNTHLFTEAEREAIEAHIPWTRVVEERMTTHPTSDGGGREIDLLPFIADHREQLVLKPNDEYGGKGIVLGWEVDQGGWEAAIKTALAEPYIVQQRVALPSEPYPSFADGRVHVVDRMVDTAPYAAYGAYVDGCLSRLSTAALLNVTAGGGSQTPTYVVEKRG